MIILKIMKVLHIYIINIRKIIEGMSIKTISFCDIVHGSLRQACTILKHVGHT